MKMACLNVVVFVALAVLVCIRAPATADSVEMCSSQTITSRTAASIVNYRNLTGHWLIKVVLEQEKNVNSRPWNVQVDRMVVRCDQRETLETTATFTVPPPYPGPDHALHADLGYYKFHAHAETWVRAREICEQEGAHLAVINSPREAEIAKELFLPFPKISGAEHHQFAWLGVRERGALNFYTIFGQPLNITGFDSWSPGEPDDSVDGCVTLHRHTGKLADIGCTLKVAFICEHEL